MSCLTLSEGGNAAGASNGGAERQVDVTLAEGVFSCLGRHFDDPVLADVVVKAQDKAFFCHRFLLCACSEVFRACLHSDTSNGIPTEVTVDGTSADTLEQILTVIYKGCNVITRENIVDIWSAAHLLRIGFLWKACESAMLKIISSKNMVEFYACGKRVNSKQVVNAIIEKMSKRFCKFAKSDSFLSVPEDVLKTVLTSPHLRASVGEVVAAIMRWINGREQQLGSISVDGSDARIPEQDSNHRQHESGSTQKLFGYLLQHVDVEKVSDPSLKLMLKNMRDAARCRDPQNYVNLLQRVEYRLNVNEYANVDNKVSIHTDFASKNKSPGSKNAKPSTPQRQPPDPPASPSSKRPPPTTCEPGAAALSDQKCPPFPSKHPPSACMSTAKPQRPPTPTKHTSCKHAFNQKLHNGALSSNEEILWSLTQSLTSCTRPPPCRPLSVTSSLESVPNSRFPPNHLNVSLSSNPSPLYLPSASSSTLLCSREMSPSSPDSPGIHNLIMEGWLGGQ